MVGAVNPSGGGLVLAPATADDAIRHLRLLAAQGFNQQVVAIEVVNVGRLPITVRRWNARIESGYSYTLLDDPLNPALPHRLEPGESATWCARLHDLERLVRTLDEGPQNVRMGVELGTGKGLRTKETVLVPTP